MDCAHLCLSEQPQCKSINYESKKKQHGGRRFRCQLNNKTKAMEPKDLVPDSAFSYFEPFKVRFGKKHYSCYVRRKYLNNSLHDRRSENQNENEKAISKDCKEFSRIYELK